jgi:hypothetical protein
MCEFGRLLNPGAPPVPLGSGPRSSAAGQHLVELDRVASPQGSVAALVPPGDIHRVTNDGDRPAISLHVYGADLRQRGTSIRRRYDLPILARRAA